MKENKEARRVELVGGEKVSVADEVRPHGWRWTTFVRVGPRVVLGTCGQDRVYVFREEAGVYRPAGKIDFLIRSDSPELFWLSHPATRVYPPEANELLKYYNDAVLEAHATAEEPVAVGPNPFA